MDTLTEKEATKRTLDYPEMMSYCKENLFKIICKEECPFYNQCLTLDYTNIYGTYPIYPGFIKREC